jgi:hypothetical protein
MVDCWKFWCQHNKHFWKHERLAISVWSWFFFLVLTLFMAEFVRKCSWLFTVKFINENMCSHESVKISNLLSRLSNEFIVLTPAIILTTVFYKINVFAIRWVFPPQNYSLLHYGVKIGKINWFDSVNFADMTRTVRISGENPC